MVMGHNFMVMSATMVGRKCPKTVPPKEQNLEQKMIYSKPNIWSLLFSDF